MGKSGIETASCDSRWTKKRGFARILARYEVCMPSRRLLSIVLRSARDVTLQLAVLIRAPSKLVWCASVYLVYTGVTIVARATVARCSFFFFSLPLSFSRTFSDTIPRRAKVLRLFRPVTGDECRLSYPWTVSIGRNINKVIEGEWHGRGKYIGCCARTYLCILLIDDKSIRRWFRLLSYYVACNDKRARLCFHNFRINNKKRAMLMNEIIRYFFLFYHPLSFTYIYIYFFFKYIL